MAKNLRKGGWLILHGKSPALPTSYVICNVCKGKMCSVARSTGAVTWLGANTWLIIHIKTQIKL